MSTTTTQVASVSQLLCVTKKILQDMAFDTKIATTVGQAEVDLLQQDAFEVIRLILSLKNELAPINRIPPEVLTLIPDYWGRSYKDVGAIPLTHVCRAWREMFSSRSSLWTRFHCVDVDKTRVYLERSKSSPINLYIDQEACLSPDDPLLHVIPHATSRLESLHVRATPEGIHDITSHLSRPAPLLKYLSINCGRRSESARYSDLSSSLFNGNLPSVRILSLMYVRTELPWRNMVNLESFILSYTPPGGVSVGQLLDFFEGAPNLKCVELCSATPTSGAQGGRLVSLASLDWLSIQGGEPCSLLLDHS